MIIIRYLFILTLSATFFLTSCSYEKMNSPDKKRFHIVEIDIKADRRTEFIIRKKIKRFSNVKSSNKVKLIIELNKNRKIQEKNIQNKVTRYNLSLSANVLITDLLDTQEFKKTFSANQIYNVAERYSNTLNNEKSANNALIDKIVDDILDQLKILYN